MTTQDTKRLFFGAEVHAPWPSELPPGRLLQEKQRHLTLAFLGNVPHSPLISLLEHFPKPDSPLGTVGYFDACLALPPRHARVIAWHARWHQPSPLDLFQKTLSQWLLQHDYALDRQAWLPHVTLCRAPFDKQAWKEAFIPLPFLTSSLHLYESLGHQTYVPIWSYALKPPFEEIEHTADIAFIIRAESVAQLYLHALTALAFKFPPFLRAFGERPVIETIDDVVLNLNDCIAKADSEVGCPLKAVSYHGEIVSLPDATLQWEMIVDV